MEAYGYPRQQEGDEPLELQEVSLRVTADELDELIDFLTAVRAEMGERRGMRIGPAAAAHWHLRDHRPRGAPPAGVDVVVVEG